jgi:hypothetical protein
MRSDLVSGAMAAKAFQEGPITGNPVDGNDTVALLGDRVARGALGDSRLALAGIFIISDTCSLKRIVVQSVRDDLSVPKIQKIEFNLSIEIYSKSR